MFNQIFILFIADSDKAKPPGLPSQGTIPPPGGNRTSVTDTLKQAIVPPPLMPGAGIRPLLGEANVANNIGNAIPSLIKGVQQQQGGSL